MKRYLITLATLFLFHVGFSQQTVGLFFNDSTSYNGYTLFAPGATTNTYLIDNCGNIVNQWSASTTNPGASVYLLENGNLLRTGRVSGNFNGGGAGGRIEIFSWDDELLWSYDYAEFEFHHHHDVAYMPNGNILLIAWVLKTSTEADQAGRNPALSNDAVWSEQVIELQPIGTDEAEIVWEWNLWDHLVQDFDPTKPNYGVVSEHPELMNLNFAMTQNKDWIHLNSINYNADLDQIILSSRHTSEIYVIDHSTTTAEAATHSGGNSGKGGDFLFRWGNPQAYDRGTQNDRKLFGQHDAKWIPQGYPNEGKIMTFNNGWQRPGGSYSSVDIIEPPFENNAYTISTNEAFEPNNLFWTYEANPPTSMYSPNISGAQPLPNGNTLICVGREGNFYEVTPTGTIVWHYKMPVSNNGPVAQGTVLSNFNIFRATRYGEYYPAFEGKDLTPGDPVELNPLPSTCEIYETPSNTNNLQKLQNIKIHNNPFTESLLIENLTNEEVIIEVFDLMGRKMSQRISKDTAIEIATQGWADGVYLVYIQNMDRNKFFSQKAVKTNHN